MRNWGSNHPRSRISSRRLLGVVWLLNSYRLTQILEQIVFKMKFIVYLIYIKSRITTLN